MGAKEKIELSASCKRLTEYINSGFSGNYQGFDRNIINGDWTVFRSILFSGGAVDEIKSILAGKTNNDNNFTEALKWIAGYLDSESKERYFKSFNKTTIDRCALITKFLNYAEDYPGPLLILWNLLRSVFYPVLLNRIPVKNEHNKLLAEIFYNKRYSQEQIKSMVRTWNPSVSKFETYFYGKFKKSILEFLSHLDRDQLLEPLDLKEEYDDQDTADELLDIEICWSILNSLLFLARVRPHKKLFFIFTNEFYQGDRNIDAKTFYIESHKKKLEELYNQIHDNTRYHEIKELLADFYNKELSLPVSSVYWTKSNEDKMIKKLADDTRVKYTMVEIYFDDCKHGGVIDYECTGQRLSTWNYHIRNTVREMLGQPR